MYAFDKYLRNLGITSCNAKATAKKLFKRVCGLLQSKSRSLMPSLLAILWVAEMLMNDPDDCICGANLPTD